MGTMQFAWLVLLTDYNFKTAIWLEASRAQLCYETSCFVKEPYKISLVL